MIGEQRYDVAVAAEHILGKSLQGFLRSDFDEHARSRVVERAQALDELHRRGHLFCEQIDHLGRNVRPGRIELSVDVGDNRNDRRLQGAGAPASPATARSPLPRSRYGKRG
jgi:hypothetical protein